MMESIKVNDLVFSDRSNPKEMFSEIMTLFSNLELWSYDALVELHKGVNELVMEICHDFYEMAKGSQKTKFTRFIKKGGIQLYVPRDRVKLLVMIYESILSGLGCSTLSGYGVTNIFKDNLKINPERQSINDIVPKNDEKINRLLHMGERRVSDDINM